MKFKIEFNPEFFNDISQAVDWYNEQQIGLGDRFFKSVKKQTTKLSTTALQYAIKYDNIRCVCIENFPYMLHYHIDKNNKSIKIEALFHTSRNPDIWDSRKLI